MATSGVTVAPPPSGAELPEHYFELYELAVEMADRVSARRAIANGFFLSVNTGLAALVGGGSFRWYVAAAGVVFALTWWALLRSYRELNRAKFGVILELEERLPARPFAAEWQRLGTGRYRELGRVERIVPWVFALIYAAELVRQLVG
jgi:hypothetical protein